MHRIELTRRGLAVAGGLGVAALAAGAASAETAPSAAEQANLKLVMDFCSSWGAADFDADKVMATYLAPQCRVRVIDSGPFLSSPAAVAQAFKAYAPHGERFKVDFLSTYAKGPIAVTQRIDTQVGGDKAGQHWPMVGVFVVRGGKIAEWTDYVAA